MEQNGKRESIFRRKNVDRINSPEALSDYVRVARPGVWIVLVTIILFLIGVFVWGIYGHLDTMESCPVKVTDGTAMLCISEYRLDTFHEGMRVYVDNKQGTIGTINQQPVTAETILNNYQMHLYDMWEGCWVYTAPINGIGALQNGTYQASVLTESASPFSLIFK